MRRLERVCATLRESVESAERSKREILSVVSHDLRNPLSVILVSSKLLLRSLSQSGMAPNVRRQLESVGRAADEINHLIQDLMDAMSLEAGGLSLSHESNEVLPLVERALEPVRPLAAQKGLEIDVDLPRDLPPLLGDRERLIQVFATLTANALKFTPKGGTITIRGGADAKQAHFSVTDTGPGIPTDQRANLFARQGGAARPVGQGTGLSIFVSKGIVEAHGGRIWVDSAAGRGSTFHFTLPLEAARRARPDGPASPAPT